MVDLIENLLKALSQFPNMDGEVRILDQGVTAIRFSHADFQLFIYPDDVADRLQIDTGEKTIHIDAYVFSQQFDKIVARVQTIAGYGRRLYARQTVAARVDKRVSMAFQEEHHLQMPMPGKYRYGLFYQGELVSLAVFSGGRRMHDKPESYRSFELIRFCHKKDQITVGGLSKLIEAFRKDFHPGDLMTYVDRDWTLDSSLQRIGFMPEKEIPPLTFYIDTETQAIRKDVPPSGSKTITKRNSGSTKLVLSFANTD